MSMTDANAKFLEVTELAGEEISQEQISRLAARYYWAAPYCTGKDVSEVACGTGPGLGYLASRAKSLRAGDISAEILAIAKKHYGDRIELEVVDATRLPYADQSLDVLIIFEAIYYLPDIQIFIREAKRVLRDGGYVLIATANKDLFDFQPSPFSHAYYGVTELTTLFEQAGFSVELFGNTSTKSVSSLQALLRPIKKVVVSLGLMPKTMQGKKLLKRLVFGRLLPMPAEISDSTCEYEAPTPLKKGVPTRDFKVIYCASRLERGS
jgi:ubiquinone/menaquinone biosynthesis C-methylase UbiE